MYFRIILGILTMTFLTGIFYLGKMIYWLWYSVQFSRKSKAFERIAEEPIILVYGDSIAFGTGASAPEKSFIGLLGKHYPKASIINHAAIGFSLDQISQSLQTNIAGDMVIICGGGIDILFLKPAEKIEKDIKNIFKKSSEKAKKVLFITPINLGLSSIFPGFLQKFYLARSKKTGEIFEKEAQRYKNIKIINNLAIDSQDQIPDWKKISGRDRVHPNDAGYLWAFEKAKNFLPLTS